MRRHTFFATLVLSTAVAAPAMAQFPRPAQRSHRAWITLSDGFGPTGGGLSGSTGMSQLLRAGATVNIANDYGIEVTGLRVQEVFPATKLVSNPVLNSPRADGVFASLAQLVPEGRGRGFPSVASLGGGVVQRPTNDPSKKRLTGAFQLGFEGNLWHPPVDWADGAMGLRLILMPAGNHRELYFIALTMGLRLG
jgi:hypothetical protein